MKNMTHQFVTQIAKETDVIQAVLLHNIAFWIKKNEANETNFFDGEYWTYNSIKAFTLLFDYLTKKQIEYALLKLTSNGWLKTGNYNKLKFDRTTWYALDDKSKSYYSETHFPKLGNGNPKIGKPIPDIKPDIKPDNKRNLNKEKISNEKFDPCNLKVKFDIDVLTHKEKLARVDAFVKRFSEEREWKETFMRHRKMTSMDKVNIALNSFIRTQFIDADQVHCHDISSAKKYFTNWYDNNNPETRPFK